jgi:spore coat polysaccharide biosynthesis protein SpsF
MDSIVAIFIQARMGSSRFPGKVLKKIGDKTILEHIVLRSMESKLANTVTVLTTIEKRDDAIIELCEKKKISFYRGSENDVLDRYYHAAIENNCDTIVRLTADCPFMDAEVIDETVTNLKKYNVDFSATRLPPPWNRSWPVGLDIEVIKVDTLKKVWNEAKEDYQRIHVMPYIYDNPKMFTKYISVCPEEIGYMRWTVDTSEDLVHLNKIYNQLSDKNDFSWRNILKVVKENSQLNWTIENEPQKNYKQG